MSDVLVLDTGALIGIERRSRKMQALLGEAIRRDIGMIVPTVVVAQAFRGGPRQANLHRFLRDPMLRYSPFDYHAAFEVGRLLGDSGTSDVVDAAVVSCSLKNGRCPIVTSDPNDIAKLDPDLPQIIVLAPGHVL